MAILLICLRILENYDENFYTLSHQPAAEQCNHKIGLILVFSHEVMAVTAPGLILVFSHEVMAVTAPTDG